MAADKNGAQRCPCRLERGLHYFTPAVISPLVRAPLQYYLAKTIKKYKYYDNVILKKYTQGFRTRTAACRCLQPEKKSRVARKRKNEAKPRPNTPRNRLVRTECDVVSAPSGLSTLLLLYYRNPNPTCYSWIVCTSSDISISRYTQIAFPMRAC